MQRSHADPVPSATVLLLPQHPLDREAQHPLDRKAAQGVRWDSCVPEVLWQSAAWRYCRQSQSYSAQHFPRRWWPHRRAQSIRVGQISTRLRTGASWEQTCRRQTRPADSRHTQNTGTQLCALRRQQGASAKADCTSMLKVPKLLSLAGVFDRHGTHATSAQQPHRAYACTKC